MPENRDPSPPVEAVGDVGIIVVAAGSGQRLGRGIPKARVVCGGRTLLEHALDGVVSSGLAGHVVVVLPEEDDVLEDVVSRASRSGSAVSGVVGGSTRSASVRAGLDALPKNVGIVLVHDAARSLTPATVFERVAAAVRSGSAAVIPVLPVVDTVKVVSGRTVVSTPDRSSLRAVQTPQGFDAAELRAAHTDAAAALVAVTDDAMLMEARGASVHVVDGDPLAFKITTPLDLLVAEAVLAAGERLPDRSVVQHVVQP